MPGFCFDKKLTFLFVIFSVFFYGSFFSQITIYEDLFSVGSVNGGSNTTAAFNSGTAPNNTNWRYTEFENSFGPSWDINSQEAVLQNTFGVNRSYGANMLYKAGNNYYTAPGGLYEQTTNFTTVFTNNTDIVEWSFNFRSPNEIPQGLTNGGAGFTGGAFVLGLDSPTLRSCNYNTVGYAVIFGDASGSGNYVKLIRVNGGTTDNNCATNNQPHYTFFNWNGANTTSCIISDNANLTTSWYSVKVQFNPANDEWRLFVRNDGGSKGDPQTLNDSHCKGANVDATYTSSNLAIMGIYACVPDDNNLRSTRWDNIRIKVGVPHLGCPSTTSLCGAYSICNTPVINSQPTNQPICSSGNATISVSTSPSSGPFQWQYYNGTSWVNVTNGSPSGFSYTNQTTSSLSISTSNANCGDYQFRVITGSSGCSVNSNSAIVSVIRAERISPTGQQCSETLINFNACPTGATYSWNVTAPSGTSSNPNSGNGQTFSFTPTNNSGLSQTFNVSASITYQGLACPFTFSPTIVSPPEAGVISGASDICVGSTLNLTSNGNSGGTWTSSNNAIASVNSSGVVTANSVGSATITYTVNATTPCTGTDIATTSISVFDGLNAGTLSSNNQTLCVGNTTVISTNGNPGGSWISSNNNVATIDANGLVTGVSPGTATITYTVSSANCGGATESSTINLTVESPVDAGILSSNATTICVGNTTTISSNGTSGGAWSSSNNSIATVDANGVVTGVNPGTVTINYQVTSSNCGGSTDNATLTITVSSAADAGTLSSNNTTICVGGTSSISTTGNPGGSWTSSDNNVATIDANGLVTGVGPGSVTITYTVNSSSCGGTTESSTINLTVESPVDAGILSSNATTICVGNTTTISSNGISGGAWSSSNNSIATVDANGVVTGVNPGTVTINYQVTSSNCGGSTDNATLTITVSSAADAGALSSNNPTICVGGTSSISTTGNPGGSWTSSDNNVATIDANGLVTGISSGTVTITYTVNSSNCGGTSESSTISITVTHGSNAGVISGVNSLCEGETTTINSNGDPGGTWSSSNTNIATINSVGLVTAISSGIVTLTYTVSSANCSGLSDVATYTLTINEGPNAGILSGLNGLCQGGSTTITSNGDIGGNWTSSNPNVVNVNPNGAVIAVAPGLATITYTVSATSVGCSNSLPSSTSSINIVVNPTPTVSVNNATICPGASANLIATPSVNGGTFNWTPGGQTSNSILVSPNLNTTYNVVYSINGCSSSPASAVVTINQITSVSFTANQTSGCVPLTIQFNSVGSNLTDCVWSFGGVETANGCAVTHTFDSPGCFDVILTSNQNGCSTSSTQTSFICVEDQPISSFSVSPTTFSESSDLVNFSNNSIGASSYIWSFGDGQNSNLENPSHFYLNTTNGIIVQLIAFSDSGCSDTSVVSIPYQEGETFYVPNSFTPDEDEHNQVFVPVFTSGFDPYNFQMLIFDRWGELVFESNDSKIGWDGTNGLNGHKVQDGTYTWKISFKNLYNDKRKSVVGHVTLIR